MCVCYPLFGIIVICNMSIIIVFIIMHIYHSTVYMFFACYGTNKLSLCDFCTFVQINNNNNMGTEFVLCEMLYVMFSDG